MQYARLCPYILVIAVAMFFANTASAVPFNIDCGSQDDVDTDPATVVGCSIATVGFITDLNVDLRIDDLDIDPYATDLEITLIHVATGTSAVIYAGPQLFDPISRMNATFDDSAAALPSAAGGDIIGIFLPEEALSAFFGHELSGDWNLSILDTAYPDEGIDLVEWRLTGNQVPEPGSGLLLGLGLFGLARLSNERRTVRRR